MKKFFFLLTGAALMFAGCAKVENENTQVVPEKGTHSVTLQATISNADTRVSADNNGIFAWQETDQISVITKYGSLEGELVFSNGITITDDKATFTFDLNEGQTLGQYAFYPAAEGCMVDSDGFIGFGLRHQLDYAPGVTNMPMLGTLSSNGASFAPVGGVIKLTVASVPSEANYLRFSVPGKKIAGTFLVDNGAIAAEDYDGSDLQAYNYVDIIIPDAYRESTMEFYIPVPTGNLGNPTFAFYKSGETNPLYSISPRIQGGLVIERKDIIVPPELDASPNYSGEWIMAGEADGDYYACPAYTSGNNIHGVEVTVNGNVVTSDNQTLKMTFTRVTTGTYKGMYTIQDANEWYLYAAGSSNNYLKATASINSSSAADYYWDIEEDPDDGFSIIASKSEKRNILRFNNTNNGPLFNCYSVTSSGVAGSNVLLYKYEDAVIETPSCATPAISCSNNVITITCGTADATIYYEIGADEATTNEPTTSSSVYDSSNKPSIAANSYVKAIAVADGYNNSTVAGASVTYTENNPETWTLVTSTSELVAGDLIVIACNTQGAVAGSLNSNKGYLTSVTSGVSFSSDNGTIVSLPSEALQFTLGGSTDEWTFTCIAGQLYTKSTNLNFSNDGNGKWKISFDNNNAIVENSTSSNEKLYYNSGSPRFKTYTSNQTAIQLYRKPAGEDTREDAQLSFSSATATATVGEPFTAPQLTKNPSDISVTWSSSDQNVAYIDQDGDEMYINKAGTTTITAKFAGNSQYKPASASYVLTVNPSYEITLQGVTDGKVFVSAANNAQVTFKVSSGYAWDTNVSFESDLASSFTITPTQSVAGDEIVVTVTSSVVNETEAARQLGSVTISNGVSTQTIQIWQKGKVSDYSNVNTSNITLTAYSYPANATTAHVKIGNIDYDALKAGTGSAAGVTRIKVPAGTKTLHIHIAAWNKESVTVGIAGATCNPSTLTLTADSGISGSGSTYTLSGSASSYYKTVSLTNITDDTILTFTATSGNRFVIWGVNAE